MYRYNKLLLNDQYSIFVKLWKTTKNRLHTVCVHEENKITKDKSQYALAGTYQIFSKCIS